MAVFQPVVGGDLLLEFGPGYNTEWFLDADESLTLNAGEGLGLGRIEDLGDTVPGGDPLPDTDNVIYSINGVSPTEGNIAISVSESLGIESEQGLIKIVMRS